MANNPLDALLSVYGGLQDIARPAIQRSAQEETRRKSYYSNELSGFESEVEKEFNNSNIDISMKFYGDWYTKNSDKFSDLEIEKYNFILDKAQRQKDENNAFDANMANIKGLTTSTGDAMEAYMGANDATEFDIETPYFVTQQGQQVKKINTVSYRIPLEKDYNTKDEYIAAYNEYADNVGQYRKEYKESLLNKVKSNLGSYTGQQSKLVDEFGDERFSGSASGRYDLQEIIDGNTLVSFGWSSINDDGVLDSEEYEAYLNAIQNGDTKSLKDFMARDGELKTFNQKQLLQEMQGLYNQGELLQVNQEKYNIAEDTANIPTGSQEWDKIKNQTAITLTGVDNKEQYFTYQQVRDAIADGGASDTHALIYQAYDSNNNLLEEAKEKLDIKNQSFIKNDGDNWVLSKKDASGSSSWNYAIDNISGQTYTPGTQIQKLVPPPPPVVTPPPAPVVTPPPATVVPTKTFEQRVADIKYGDDYNPGQIIKDFMPTLPDLDYTKPSNKKEREAKLDANFKSIANINKNPWNSMQNLKEDIESFLKDNNLDLEKTFPHSYFKQLDKAFKSILWWDENLGTHYIPEKTHPNKQNKIIMLYKKVLRQLESNADKAYLGKHGQTSLKATRNKQRASWVK